jgi:hypothetical protein
VSSLARRGAHGGEGHDVWCPYSEKSKAAFGRVLPVADTVRKSGREEAGVGGSAAEGAVEGNESELGC